MTLSNGSLVSTTIKGVENLSAPQSIDAEPYLMQPQSIKFDRDINGEKNLIVANTGRMEVIIVNRDLIEVGNKGQKVDYMTFRGEFEKELNDVKKNNSNFRNALDEEDLERIDTIIKEEIFDKPEMYFNKERLNEAYNLPIDIASLTLNILNGDNLPTKNEIIQNYVDDLSYRNKLSSKDKQILQSIISYIFNDKDSFKKFLEGDYSIFNTTQFNQLGGIKSIQNLKDRENIFNEIRDSRLNF